MRMIDPFGRTISYLRVSVTDRCDFRCVYCMAEEMNFLPKAELLTLEELDRVCSAFVRLGVRKLRLTGGEPLVRRNIMTLFRALGRHLETGALDELTLTTNGSQLARYADELRRLRRAPGQCLGRHARPREVHRDHPPRPARPGARRASPPPSAPGSRSRSTRSRCAASTRTSSTTSSPGAASEGFDLVFIEVMPMGDIGGENRLDQYLPLSLVRARLQRRWTLDESDYRTGGPARYVHGARDRPAARLHHAADP